MTGKQTILSSQSLFEKQSLFLEDFSGFPNWFRKPGRGPPVEGGLVAQDCKGAWPRCTADVARPRRRGDRVNRRQFITLLGRRGGLAARHEPAGFEVQYLAGLPQLDDLTRRPLPPGALLLVV